MNAPDRECRIAGCENQHARNLFCCRTHWFRLPKPTRDAIWTAFRSEEGVLSDAYAQAAENAEAYLEDRPARDLSEATA